MTEETNTYAVNFLVTLLNLLIYVYICIWSSDMVLIKSNAWIISSLNRHQYGVQI